MNIMLDEKALMPTRGHATDAGLDLLSPIDTVVPAKGSISIDTGVHIELSPNTAGSIVVKLYNHSNVDYAIKRGDKITQLVVMQISIPNICLVQKFEETERGNGGFGSTGR